MSWYPLYSTASSSQRKLVVVFWLSLETKKKKPKIPSSMSNFQYRSVITRQRRVPGRTEYRTFYRIPYRVPSPIGHRSLEKPGFPTWLSIQTRIYGATSLVRIPRLLICQVPREQCKQNEPFVVPAIKHPYSFKYRVCILYSCMVWKRMWR